MRLNNAASLRMIVTMYVSRFLIQTIKARKMEAVLLLPFLWRAYEKQDCGTLHARSSAMLRG
jgi:hypothetical protein